jgi:hypothetical protein
MKSIFQAFWTPQKLSSVDSGVGAEATPTDNPGATPTTSVEEEMSLALIQLQTLAATITSNLQRAEYSTLPK